MLYQTIALELIQNRPTLCALLRKEKLMLTATELFAHELKASYKRWLAQLSMTASGEASAQTRSQAAELAINQMMLRLPPESGLGTPTAEEVLAYVKARLR